MSRALLSDLQARSRAESSATCDICIVGAGAAGIYLGARLTRIGFDVVLMEAGSTVCDVGEATGFEAEFVDEVYRGATLGRFFGLGGSTSVWGGQLVPHGQADLRGPDEPLARVWTHLVQVVAEQAHDVLRALGYPGKDHDAFARAALGEQYEALTTAGITPSASLVLPFRQKNFTSLVRDIGGRGSLRIVLNAVAHSWGVRASGGAEARFQYVVASSTNGNSIRVTAERFVMAAGSIESTRSLLEINARYRVAPIHPKRDLGKYLSDHLSITIADVAPDSRASTARVFAPRFDGAWMRSFRFTEADFPQDSPRAFFHLIFPVQDAGFDVAKKVLAAVQARRIPRVSPVEVYRGLTGLTALATDRYLRSRLHVPRGTATHLQLDIEQARDPRNHITLGAKTDRYGRRVAVIDWAVRGRDLENLETIAGRILQKWPGPRAGLPALSPRALVGGALKPYDAYHPVGTCRMGDDEEAVVGMDLKVHGLDNLWVVSTAVLPSAGTANPTLTMLCLAEWLTRRFGSAGGTSERSRSMAATEESASCVDENT